MYRAIKNRIIVELDNYNSETESGFVIVPGAQTTPVTGKIISAGKEVKTLKEGDRVQTRRYAGQILENNNKKYVSITENDVDMIVDDDYYYDFRFMSFK